MNKAVLTLTLLLMTLLIGACQQNQKIDKEDKKDNKSWILNQQYSSISIITTKNNKVAEVSNFQSFSGTIDTNGKLEITIDLSSLETNIPIRNERISEHLFQTNIYPTADIHAQLKPEDLDIGIHNISFDLDLHGISVILQAEFTVFEQFGNKVVTLHKPLIIKAETFALEKGITTLKNIAKLQSIDFTVPVNLTLSFQAE